MVLAWNNYCQVAPSSLSFSALFMGQGIVSSLGSSCIKELAHQVSSDVLVKVLCPRGWLGIC